MENSQTIKLYNLLSDGKPHNTIEIMEKVYSVRHSGVCRVGARIYDIKKRFGVNINGWKDEENKSIYWYELKTL